MSFSSVINGSTTAMSATLSTVAYRQKNTTVVVTPTVDNAPAGMTYQWSLLKPGGSTANLTSTTASAANFIPDREGTYTLTLVLGRDGVLSPPHSRSIEVKGVSYAQADIGEGMMCAGVTTVTGQTGLVLRAELCRDLPNQRFVWDDTGRLHMASDHSQCLTGTQTPNGLFQQFTEVRPTPCGTSRTQVWETSAPTNGSVKVRLVDFPWRRWEVQSFGNFDGVRVSDGTVYNMDGWMPVGELIEQEKAQAAAVVNFPIMKSPPNANQDLELLRHKVGMLQPPHAPAAAAPVIDAFPGRVPDTVPLAGATPVQINRTSGISSTLQYPRPQNWVSTGLYAKPNGVFTVNVANPQADLARTFLFVGSNFWTVGPYHTRHPRWGQSFPLRSGVNTFRHYYGGPVFLVSGADANVVVNATIDGQVVRMPSFKLGDDEAAWKASIASSSAPLYELSGNQMVSLLQTSHARGLLNNDPGRLQPQSWTVNNDRYVVSSHDLGGVSATDPNPVHRPHAQRQRLFFEPNLSGDVNGRGSYPTVVDSNGFVAANYIDYLVAHEFGHRFHPRWMVAIGTESAADVFSFKAQEDDLLRQGLNPSTSSFYWQLITARFPSANAPHANGTALYNKLTSSTPGAFADFTDGQLSDHVVMWLQLRLAFPQGWETIRRMHRQFRVMDTIAFDDLTTDDFRNDQVYRQASIAACHDLRDFFTRWGMAPTAAALADIAARGLPQPSAANPPWLFAPADVFPTRTRTAEAVPGAACASTVP